jgi:hypothetical protein
LKANEIIETPQFFELIEDLHPLWYAPLKSIVITKTLCDNSIGVRRSEFILMKGIYYYMSVYIFPLIEEHKKYIDNGGVFVNFFKQFIQSEQVDAKIKAEERKNAFKTIKKMKEGVLMIDMTENVIVSNEETKK